MMQPFDARPAPAQIARGEPWRRRFGPAPGLEGEHRRQRGQARRVEPVEQAVVEAGGDEEIGLVVDAPQALTCLGQGPTVEVPPALEHSQHPVEGPGQGGGTALHVPLDGGDLALQSLDRGPRLPVTGQVGALAGGMGANGQRQLVDLRIGVAPAQAGPPDPGPGQVRRHLSLEGGGVGGIGLR